MGRPFGTGFAKVSGYSWEPGFCLRKAVTSRLCHSVGAWDKLTNIKQIITSTPPPFAERMVQTIKNMIHQRLVIIAIYINSY